MTIFSFHWFNYCWEKKLPDGKDIGIMPHILPGVRVRVSIDQNLSVACSFHPVFLKWHVISWLICGPFFMAVPWTALSGAIYWIFKFSILWASRTSVGRIWKCFKMKVGEKSWKDGRLIYRRASKLWLFWNIWKSVCICFKRHGVHGLLNR